jgi:chromosome segregation ATPase
MTFPFEWLTREHKLDAIYQTLLRNQELTMALQDQVAELTTRVGVVETALNTAADKLAELGASVDAEQQEVADAIALLSQDNPALTDAIAKLTGVTTSLDAISTAIDTTKADVESTVTPAPAPEPEPPVA